MTRRGEFEFVADIFGPLATDPSALDLGDDGAILATREGMEVVVTTDAMVEGRHFTADFPPDLLGQKLLRVNLSDLAAMGAEPAAYTLTAALPIPPADDWLEAFARGLGRDQARYGVALIGGDTVAASASAGKLFSVTMFGHVEAGHALRRSGARPGDTVYVSGTIGDAMLGYEIARGALGAPDRESAQFLQDRFRLPSPRVKLGRELRGLVNAVVDISDGLVADLGHICQQSGVGAEISAEKVPQSGPGAVAMAATPENAVRRLTWGEDYELVFCADPAMRNKLNGLAERLGTDLTAIGSITAGSGVELLNPNGQPIAVESGGYRHF